jgi:hypothetical protein
VPAARNVMPMIESGMPNVKPMIVTCSRVFYKPLPHYPTIHTFT